MLLVAQNDIDGENEIITIRALMVSENQDITGEDTPNPFSAEVSQEWQFSLG